MNKYYSLIGSEHHRFSAINIYAAREVARSFAKPDETWSEPVLYNASKHGQYFWEYGA